MIVSHFFFFIMSIVLKELFTSHDRIVQKYNSTHLTKVQQLIWIKLQFRTIGIKRTPEVLILVQDQKKRKK